MKSLRVGILALQGDFDSHRQAVEKLGAKTLLVKKASELDAIDRLILPGGESSTILKLLDEEFRTALSQKLANALPVLATCAGAILLAKNVTNPNQFCFNAIDVDITRNAYGRQLDSFVATTLHWKPDCEDLLSTISGNGIPVEGVFIRAPKITRTGKDVRVLIEHEGDPVLVKEKNIIAATFHPELSNGLSLIHQLLLSHS